MIKQRIINFFFDILFILLSIPFIFLNGLAIIFEEDPDKMMERHKDEKYRGWVLVCVKLAYCLKWFKGFFRRSK